MKDTPSPIVVKTDGIKQRKGEAEMSQVDWLWHIRNSLSEGDTIASLVASGDIDAVVIHMFALSRNWPRKSDRTFCNIVYVVLQKPFKTFDIYNITSIIEYLEKHFQDQDIGAKVALALCLGGNDFIPKLYGISHEKIMKLFISDFKDTLFVFDRQNKDVSVSKQIFTEFIKCLYSPNKKNLAFEQVQQLTMQIKRQSNPDKALPSTANLRNAKQWMPPLSCLLRVADLVNLQINYLQTAGFSSMVAPDFLSSNCLRKNESGEIEYDFGPESRKNVQDLLMAENLKRKSFETPQKGRRRKSRRPMTSTPSK